MANIRIDVTNIDAEFRRLQRELTREVSRDVGEAADELIQSLRARTPVDTGRARAGWQRGPVLNNPVTGPTVKVFNNVPYIDELNMGTSRQAPARFIEATALRRFLPRGTIVEIVPDIRRF